MAIKRKQDLHKSNVLTISVASLLITIVIFLSLLMLGSILNQSREHVIDTKIERLYGDLNTIQMLTLITNTYDNEMACLVFEENIKDLDSYIWELGQDIDKYRAATEEFQKSEYYQTQKKAFNSHQFSYFLLMKNMVDRCNISKDVILYFYVNSADCNKCDDQSFILTDISELDDKDGVKDIAIFSFDMDLNITSISILAKYYEVDHYPCLIINEQTYCGIQGRDFILEKICSDNSSINVCQ